MSKVGPTQTECDALTTHMRYTSCPPCLARWLLISLTLPTSWSWYGIHSLDWFWTRFVWWCISSSAWQSKKGPWCCLVLSYTYLTHQKELFWLLLLLPQWRVVASSSIAFIRALPPSLPMELETLLPKPFAIPLGTPRFFFSPSDILPNPACPWYTNLRQEY